MKFACLLLAAAAAACPGAAIAQDTESPRQLLEELGMAPSDKKVRKAIAKAEDKPLGTKANPVRASGPQGERAYIARLRCADGAAPRIGTRSSAGIGAFGTIIDIFPLDCGEAAPGKVDLVMDMYHDHQEDRAPAGFTIVPR